MADIFTEHDGMISVALDGGQVESPDEFYSGNRVSKEGLYHVSATRIQVHKADEDKKKLPTLEIDLVVLDGTDADGNRLEDQIEKIITHRIFLAKWEDKESGVMKALDDKAQKGVRAFAYAFGLISEADLGKAVKVPFHLIEGRQAVVKVKRESEWTDDSGNKRQGSLKIAWNNDCWPVTHERVKDVHKNREALALLVGAGAVGGPSDDDLSDI